MKNKLSNMKNLMKNVFTFLAMGSVLFMTSCGEDEEVLVDGPSITITSNQFAAGETTYEGVAGENVSFTVDVAAPGGFNNIKVEYLVDGSDAGIDDWTDQRDAGTTVTTYSGTPTGVTLLESNVGQELSFVITVVDDNGKQATLTLTTTVTSAPLENVVATLLAAPLGDKTSKTFYSVPLARTVTSSEVISNEDGTASSSDVDFGYYYGTQNKASIAAPSDYPAYDLGPNGQQWSTLNATAFKTTELTAAQFLETTTFAQVETAFENGTDAGQKVNNLAVGQIVAFETVERDGKKRKGLIHIKSIVEGSDADGKIDVEILVQK